MGLEITEEVGDVLLQLIFVAAQPKASIHQPELQGNAAGVAAGVSAAVESPGLLSVALQLQLIIIRLRLQLAGDASTEVFRTTYALATECCSWGLQSPDNG